MNPAARNAVIAVESAVTISFREFGVGTPFAVLSGSVSSAATMIAMPAAPAAITAGRHHPNCGDWVLGKFCNAEFRNGET
jgi:hypothetical protein